MLCIVEVVKVKNRIKIYIMLAYTGTLYSKILKRVLKNKYVHVSIAMDKELKKLYSFGRKNPTSMFPCGFVNENIENITNVFSKAECQIFELEITNEEYNKLENKINEFKIRELEYGYNILGLIPLNFNIKLNRKKHFVCSQFIGYLLQEAGIYDFKKSYSLIKPKDIKEIDNLNKVYEGKMKNALV